MFLIALDMSSGKPVLPETFGGSGPGCAHRLAKRRRVRHRRAIGRGSASTRNSREVGRFWTRRTTLFQGSLKKSAADGPDVARAAAWRSTPQPWKPGGLAIAPVGYILVVCVKSANRLKLLAISDQSRCVSRLVLNPLRRVLKLPTAANVLVGWSQQPRLAAALAAAAIRSGATAASTYPTSQCANEEGVMDHAKAREDGFV